MLKYSIIYFTEGKSFHVGMKKVNGNWTWDRTNEIIANPDWADGQGSLGDDVTNLCGNIFKSGQFEAAGCNEKRFGVCMTEHCLD